MGLKLRMEGKNSPPSDLTELTLETDKRFHQLRDELKRAIDVLGSSLLDRMKTEHEAHSRNGCEQWDREQKSREVHSDHYKELLFQERSAREAIMETYDRKLERWVDSVERSIVREQQLIWSAIRENTHEGSVNKVMKKE